MTHINKDILIDGALWVEDMKLAKQFNAPYCSLYRGKPAEELNDVAPYLFCISDNKDFEDWINARERKYPIERRTLRLASELDMESLRKHLRRFLRMRTETGMYIYSRFYDPYVLNCLLPNLTQAQLDEFLTPIDFLITEDARINERRTFRLSADKELQIKYEAINDVDDK